MVEITEEEMDKKVETAVLKEQRIIALDQFYREGLMATAQKVNMGLYDPFIYQCGTEEYEKFKKENPHLVVKKKGKEKEEKKNG